MQGLTFSQLCQLPDAEQLRDERIAIIMDGEGCDEETAIAILDKSQMSLFCEQK